MRQSEPARAVRTVIPVTRPCLQTRLAMTAFKYMLVVPALLAIMRMTGYVVLPSLNGLAGHACLAGSYGGWRGTCSFQGIDLTIMRHGFCQEALMSAPGVICRDNIFVKQIHTDSYFCR